MNWELLIFDCDGVLVDSETIGNRVIARELKKLGIDLPFEVIIDTFTGNFLNESLKKIENLSGVKIPTDEFVPRYRQASFEAFKKEMKPIPGIPELIRQLKKPFCVASNGPRNKIELNLSLTGLLPFFEDRIFSAYELQTWKPDPAFYLSVCQTLNTAPAESIVVEDSRYGVASGVAAGIRVLGYTAGNESKQKELSAEGATTFDDMCELPKILGL